MLEKPEQHKPRDNVEVGVAIPIGCMVPLAIAAAMLVGAGVMIGARLQPAQVASESRGRAAVRQ